jgi:hypothetical protein
MGNITVWVKAGTFIFIKCYKVTTTNSAQERMVNSNKSDITKASKRLISRNLRQSSVDYVFPMHSNINPAK